MSQNENVNVNESLIELSKLVELLDEDAGSLELQQTIQDYLAPILLSVVAEIDANRQFILATADRSNLAMMMSEKTFLGELITNFAEHFSVVSEHLETLELPENVQESYTEIQDLLATWMSFASDEDEDEGEDYEFDEEEFEEEEEDDSVASRNDQLVEDILSDSSAEGEENNG